MSASILVNPLSISEHYSLLGYPNGGYLAALGAKHMLELVPHADPLALSVSFLSHPKAGEGELEIELLDVSKSLSRVRATLWQEGRRRVAFLATFTDLALSRGATRSFVTARPRTPWEDCVPVRSLPALLPSQPLFDRLDVRIKPGQLSDPSESNPAEIEGWVASADGSVPTLGSLILFADVFPPPIFNTVAPDQWGSVPTLEFSVHLKAAPRPGPVHGHFCTQHVVGGYVQIDGELHDVTGTLVAVSRQIAKYRGR